MGSLAKDVLAGDRRAAARLISMAENRGHGAREELGALYRRGGHARTIGITGPPGAGKSTLVDGLIARFRAENRTVAVAAVDPSSPYSHGAVLGDRVRMMRHADDPGVLVRSMASRGALGGLSTATADAITVFDAMRFDIVIVETVGVGQSETDIVGHTECVLLLQTALGGDDVQAIKAGVLEIADIMVVNKKNIPGSERMARWLRESLHDRAMRSDRWTVPVLLSEASDSAGVNEIFDATLRRFEHNRNASFQAAIRHRQVAAHMTALAAVEIGAFTRRLASGQPMPERWQAVLDRRADPYTLAAHLFAQMG